MLFLGFNWGETGFGKKLKDGSVTILKSNGAVRSIAEERVTQLKAKGGFAKALKYILKIFKVHPDEITTFVSSSCIDFFPSQKKTLNIGTFQTLTNNISHHYSHALYSFVLSKFEKAIVVVWDCGGNYYERVSNNEWWNSKREQHSYYLATRDGNIQLIDSDFEKPGELGFGEIYRSLTHLLGFGSYIHSSKAMAITSLGDKSRWKDICLFDFNNGKISSPFTFNNKNDIQYLIDWARANLDINISQVQSDEDLKNKDLIDFAAFIQKSIEETAIKKIDFLAIKFNVKSVCLGGGVSLNCVLNTKIRQDCNIDDLFIPPASGDTGQSMGNAIAGYFRKYRKLPKIKEYTYIGSDCDVNSRLERQLAKYYYLKMSESSKIELAANLLNEGHILGWCQGKSEWGPRALGNRSILCRADDPNVEDRLRNEIKFRKWYEPFAASIAKEDFCHFFNSYDELPFMLEIAFPKADKRKHLLACLHIADNSCRVQTVTNTSNPLFYRLLNKYKEVSGNSILLNTSLNQRGYPIAETSENAFEFYKNSKIEILFVDNHFVTKSKSIFELAKEYTSKTTMSSKK